MPRAKTQEPAALEELLLQGLETEMGGVEVYRMALKCVVNEDLKGEWEEYLEQTERHAGIMKEHPEAYPTQASVQLKVAKLRDQIVAPARTILFLLLAGLCLGAWTDAPLTLLGLFIGPVAIGAYFTLRERAMLGDTGSNVLGAAVGLAAVLALDGPATLVVLVVLAALNAASEWVSFSAVIDRTPPLRWFDHLGRRAN